MRLLTVFAGFLCVALLGILYLSLPVNHPAPPKAPTNTPEARSRWEFERTKNPATGDIPSGIKREELVFSRQMAEQSQGAKKRAAIVWEQAGPDTLGGRTRALAVDVTDDNTIIAGAVSGGIWKSTDGGASWSQTLTPTQLLSVTSLTQDTRVGETDTWYAGTGELSGNSTSASGAYFYGDGIYKSIDGGDSWTLLSSTSTDRPESFDQEMDFVWRVVTDASNPAEDEVYAAVYSGIYRSVNGGITWTEVLSSSGALYTDIVISSTGVLYAALTGTNSGIWRSTDGISWTDITAGGWAGSSARTALALAPSNEDVLYTITNSPGAGTYDHSLWKYTHSTTTWVNRSANIPDFGSFQNAVFDSQGGYDLHIAVKPDDEATVFIGGTSLYRSRDGFQTTNSDWIGGYSGGTDDWSGPHHADQHIVTFSPSDPDIMYSGSDGGVHRTNDNLAAEVSWTSLNRGYLSGQFYSVAVDHTSSSNMALLGGTQDNGTWFVDDPDASTLGEEIWGGDGAFVSLWNDGDLRYASFQNGQIYRLTYNASNQLTSWALASTSLESSYLFIHPYVLDPNDSEIMYLPGSQQMHRNTSLSSIPNYQSSTHTIGWQTLANTTISGGGVISAVIASESNPDHRVYYGTSVGKVYRIDNADTGSPTAVDVTSGLFPGSAYVSSIAVHPENADQVAVVFSNYSVQSVFYSDDAGANWTNVSGSLEENADGSGSGPSVRSIKIGKISGTDSQYFVGTSTGLYSTTTLNGTSTVWTQEGATTIGNVVVDMIDIRNSDGYIAIGTHGNGYYTSMLDRPEPITAPGGIDTNLELWLKADAGVTLSSGNVATWADQSTNSNDASAGDGTVTESTAGVNFNPSLEWDAATDDLRGTSNLNLDDDNTLTIFAVLVDEGSGDFESVFNLSGHGTEHRIARANSSSPWTTLDDSFTSNLLANSSGAAADATTWSLVTSSYTGTQYTTFLNAVAGTPVATTQGIDTDGGATYSIGEAYVNDQAGGLFELSELIVYSDDVSANFEEIESYLAIKYGIFISSDYLASDATTLWDATANTTYHNDVAGIGRDDDSALNQKQSTSQSGGILEIGLGTLAADNASNANTFSTDVNFMVWGHDNASASVATDFSGSSTNTRMARIWTVEETGTVGTVEIQIPDSYGATHLIVSSSSALTSPTETALTDNGDGTMSTTVDFADGAFFTFGANLVGPGGVKENLALWLKADAGISTSGSDVTTWADQSSNNYNFSDGGAAPYTYDADGLNYNPEIINADGSDRRLENTSSISLQTVAIVVDPDNPDNCDNPFSEVGSNDEGIRLCDTSGANWNVPGNTGDFTNTTGQGWHNGTLSTNPAHNNVPQMLLVEATASATIANGIELGDTQLSRYWHGSIAEVIGYTATLSTTDREKVQSYLAIKYGITAGHDYVASDGTTLWDAGANSTYHNDVIGIARDDESSLNQKQTTADILSFALGGLAADNASNANTFSSDLSVLMLGHDTGGLTESPITISATTGQILGRTWLAEETNESGTLEVQFDLTGLTITGTEAQDFYLVLDTDSDPTNGSRQLIRASSFASDIATFTSVDIEDGDYVMLLTDYVAGTTDAPLADGQAAAGVIGQSNLNRSGANTGGVSAATVDGPSFLAIGPTGKLFVSDTDNNRVLRWSSANAAQNGSNAEAVLGQANFTSSDANRGGTAAANTLYEPHGVFVSSAGALYVADYRNNRILRFDNAENASNGAAADAVLGQADFTSNDANRLTTAAANSLSRPMDLYVDDSGNLWASDWLNHRVLRYDNVAAKANGAAADGVLGQGSFTSSSRMWKDNTDADSFVYPSGICVDQDGVLWVADSGNSRVLRFDTAAGKANGAAADGVLGQPDFTSWRTVQGTGTAANTLQWPDAGLDVDNNGRLWVADRWGDRVIWFHNAASKANGADADGVIGQPSFTSRDGAVDNNSFNAVNDVLIDESNDYVWVTDHNHNRVLRFNGTDTALGKINTLNLASMLDFWLMASVDAYADPHVTEFAEANNAVHVWLDQSRHGFTALADTPPMFIDNAINGYPAIQFVGEDARMRIEGGIFGKEDLDSATVWAIIADEATGTAPGNNFVLRMNTNSDGGSASGTIEGTEDAPPVSAMSYNSEANLLLGEIPFTTGMVAELMATFQTPSETESGMVATYLALKYSIPFEQTYISTTGDTLWDRSQLADFGAGVAGIGRDDAFGLLQTTAKAAGADNVLMLSRPATTLDSTTFVADNSFVLWGHNDEPLAINLPTDLFEAPYQMTRTWFIQETGDIDSLKVMMPAGTRAEYLLVDDTQAFSDPLVIPLTHSTAGEYLEAYLNVDESAYITFAASTAYEGYGALPGEFTLYQNYPNPFNPTTTIRFDLPENTHAYMELYDILGRRVRVLLDEEMSAGTHNFLLDAADLASGVYFYHMRVNNEIRVQKMLLTK